MRFSEVAMFVGVLGCAAVPALHAHEPVVHQYMVKQAYLFLEREKGVIQELKDRVGLDWNGYGDAAQPWKYGFVSLGAWREDMEDPVYGYSFGYKWTPTCTHFWDADAGDDATTTLPLTPGAPNAYTKARIYLFGGAPIYFVRTAFDPQLLQIVVARLYTYSSLVDFYRTGRCRAIGYVNLAGAVCSYPWGIRDVVMDLPTARGYAALILGRVTHLLTDICTPAHTHNDYHIQEPALDPDRYEPYMYNNYLRGFYDPGYGFSNYDATWARRQGGLPDAYRCVPGGDPRRCVRYLFYTADQIAGRFPSEDADGNLRYVTSYGGDDYSWLNIIQQISASFSAGTFDPYQINCYAFRYGIRATADLLYWFATETGMLSKVTVLNNFGSGRVQVNAVNGPSGYNIGVQPGSTLVLTAITPQNSVTGTWYFTGWQKLDDAGNVLAESSSPSWTVTVSGRAVFKALFVSPVVAMITGPGILPYGARGTFAASVSGGTPPYRYQWWIRYTGTVGGTAAAISSSVRPGTTVPMRPEPGLTWYQIGTDSPALIHTALESFALKCVVTDAALQGATSNILDVQTNSVALNGRAPGSGECVKYELFPAFPNPFNPRTEVRYQVPDASMVKLTVFDLLGREVCVLVNGYVSGGTYSVEWNAQSVPSGAYFVRMWARDAAGKGVFVRTNALFLTK